MDKAAPLKPEDVRYNGGQRCDMLSGPCSCGAWHDPNMPKKMIKSNKGGGNDDRKAIFKVRE